MKKLLLVLISASTMSTAYALSDTSQAQEDVTKMGEVKTTIKSMQCNHRNSLNLKELNLKFEVGEEIQENEIIKV